MNNLSNERLEQIAYGSVRQSGEEGAWMARELLALRGAGKEPVSRIEKSPQGETAHGVISKEDAEYIKRNGYMTIPLYAAPQLPVPNGLVSAVNRLLDSDGSRGCYSSIRCGDARDEVERLLAAPKLPAVPGIAIEVLKLALQAMEFMGDTLNNLDAVCAEDVECVTHAFEAVRAAIAAAPKPEVK